MKPKLTSNPLDANNFRHFSKEDQLETFIGKTAIQKVNRAEKKDPYAFAGFN